MAQITVTIAKGNDLVSTKTTEISSNALPDLIASVKTAKAETNSILSDLVDKQKSSHARARVSSDEEEGSEEDDEENCSKKQKT